jgi:hypothetical protein
MTVHGLSSREGRKWLRHRLRRWQEIKHTPSKHAEENKGQKGKEEETGLEISEMISPEPSEMMNPDTSEMMGPELCEMTEKTPG